MNVHEINAKKSKSGEKLANDTSESVFTAGSRVCRFGSGFFFFFKERKRKNKIKYKQTDENGGPRSSLEAGGGRAAPGKCVCMSLKPSGHMP